MHTSTDCPVILIHKDGKIFPIALSKLQDITGAVYMPSLDFVDFPTLRKITKTTTNMQKKGSFDRQVLWLSAYFQKDILSNRIPDVSLRWINEEVGWGVFTEREFDAMEFIAEYSGIVRKRRKHDSKNAYCFEYPLDPCKRSPLIVDAMDQGGISRYINHDFQPNLMAAFTHIDGINHIVLYTLTKIGKNRQLYYNYGLDYWKSRTHPRSFSSVSS